ncbi:voltage-gated potassium channel [Methanolinea mesophila]|uniref:ion transporter n=1 Tax=Methanolinea mesophila TaxID=547055 RepID=UPI001AE2F9F7|nr:voltage-gated potassium channel [Methanolinea mesophila]
MSTLKHKIYEVLEPSAEQGTLSFLVDIFLIVLILANVVVILMETMEPIHALMSPYFVIFDLFSVGVFTVEYLLRVWTCTENPEYSSPLSGRAHYIVTPLALVDLLAILPFYIPFVIPVDLRFLRILRLIRLIRVFKLARYSDAMALFFRVLRREKALMLVLLSVVGFLLVISSSFLYYAEHEVQPEDFSSIPETMWWSIATLTTVGYGDVYPITPVGKFFAALTALFGIGLFALPAGILASGFVEEIREGKIKKGEGLSVSSPEDRVALLERAVTLRTEGHLEEEEFRRLKEAILSGEKEK